MARKISVASTRKGDSSSYALYTVPVKNSALWSLLFISSTEGSVSVDASWYDASTGSTYPIVGAKNLSKDDTIMFNQAEVVLQEGDIIYIKNTSGSYNATFIVTLELVPNQATQFHGG